MNRYVQGEIRYSKLSRKFTFELIEELLINQSYGLNIETHT